MKVVLKCVRMEIMGLCVMLSGEGVMEKLFANSWAIALEVYSVYSGPSLI